MYMAINQRTKRQLACKIVNLHAMSLGGHAEGFMQNQRDIEASHKRRDRWTREVEILQLLNHVCDYDALEAHC